MALANYVKFRRGTPASYAALAVKDADSLYFISEKDATQGVLYLGDKLISGSLTSNISLSDLEDILLSSNVTPNSVLIYDGEAQKWVNKPFSEIFSEITGSLVEMQGATANADGASGMVPKPVAGDQNKFLRGDAQWIAVNEFTPTDAAKLNTVEEAVTDILGDDAGSGLSMREVAAEEVAKIVAEAPASFDTLKEIADWIENHPDTTDINNRLTAVENGLSNVQGDLSSMQGDITYLNNAITDVQGDITNLQSKDDDLQAQITAIDNRLRWEELDEG